MPGAGVFSQALLQQADQHLPQQHRVALGDQIRRRSRVRSSTPSGGSTACDRLLGRDGHVDDLGLAPLPGRLDPRQREQRLGEAGHPLGVVGEAVEEAVAGLGVVLGAAAQHLDRRCVIAGERVAQLVRGVGDELALGLLALELLGAVADDHQHGVLGRHPPGLHAVDPVIDREHRDLVGAALGGATQGRDQRRRGLAVADEPLAGGVGEAHLAVLADHDHAPRAARRRSPRGGRARWRACRSCRGAPRASCPGSGSGRRSRRRRPRGSGASKWPAAICSAPRARRLTRIAISEETTKPTRTPITIAIMSARRRSPRSSSKARVSAGGGSATTMTVPRTTAVAEDRRRGDRDGPPDRLAR